MFVLFVDEEEAEAGNASASVADAEAPVFASAEAKTLAKAFCINGVCRRVACSSGVMRRRFRFFESLFFPMVY